MDIPEKLPELLQQNPLIIGIGNELRGDDKAGIKIANLLKKKGHVNTLAVYSTPENYLQKISEMPGDVRIWIDVINWNAAPGEIRLFSTQEIAHYSISTHNFSPIVLVNFLKNMRDIPDFFLGIQPLKLALGDELSEPVSRSIKFLVDFMDKKLEAK